MRSPLLIIVLVSMCLLDIMFQLNLEDNDVGSRMHESICVQLHGATVISIPSATCKIYQNVRDVKARFT